MAGNALTGRRKSSFIIFYIGSNASINSKYGESVLTKEKDMKLLDLRGGSLTHEAIESVENVILPFEYGKAITALRYRASVVFAHWMSSMISRTRDHLSRLNVFFIGCMRARQIT